MNMNKNMIFSSPYKWRNMLHERLNFRNKIFFFFSKEKLQI